MSARFFRRRGARASYPSALAQEAAALTLVEVLCALAIASLIMGAILGVVSATVRSVEGTRAAMRGARLVAGIERLLRLDLEAACAAREKGLRAFVGKAAAPADEEEISLAFFTANSFAPPGSQSGTGLARVEYLLRPSRRKEEVRELLRRETPYTAGKPLNSNESLTEVVADGIALWRTEFYDGTAWQETWARDRMPHGIRLSYAFAPSQDEAAPPAQTSLFAPIADPDADPMPPSEGAAK